MGRGRVQLKRIENKINRQVTFSKRRNGLMKKASELAILCDAEIAVIVFSNRGKLYEFCSSSMSKVLERYRRCSLMMQNSVEYGTDGKDLHSESLELKKMVEFLHKKRVVLEEDLDGLDYYQLEEVEGKLSARLKEIRARKEEVLQEMKTTLETKVREAHLNLQSEFGPLRGVDFEDLRKSLYGGILQLGMGSPQLSNQTEVTVEMPATGRDPSCNC